MKEIDKDFYRVCHSCNEQNHVDDMIGKICVWCWQDLGHAFFCDNGHEFSTVAGVAIMCPICGTFDIGTITNDFKEGMVIKEIQKEFLNRTPSGKETAILTTITPKPCESLPPVVDSKA